MIKKITLIAFSSLMMIGCDGAIKSIANGKTTDEDIKKTSKVLIITDIDTGACVILKTAMANEYPSGKSLVKDSGTTCDTFNKNSTDCKMQSLADLKSESTNSSVKSLQSGSSTCVIGGDKSTAN